MYQSLLLPISLLQDNYSPMVVESKMFLKTWCPQMQLSMASPHSMLLVLVVSCRAGACAQVSSMGACLGQAWSSPKLKSANIFVCAGFGQSAKFNSHQIFQLCGTPLYSPSHTHTTTLTPPYTHHPTHHHPHHHTISHSHPHHTLPHYHTPTTHTIPLTIPHPHSTPQDYNFNVNATTVLWMTLSFSL